MRATLVLTILVACSHPAPRPEPITDEAPAGGTANATSSSTTTQTSSTPDTTSTTTTTKTSSTTTAGPPGPSVLASCPATYAEAAAGTCELASIGKLSCPYADGACACSEYRPCSGMAMPYDEARKHPKPAWTCTPKLRADGCAGAQPRVGSACARDAQECSYGSCGGQILACRSGAWAIARMIPPPPAAHH